MKGLAREGAEAKELGKILDLLGNADSVELKLSIADTDQRSVAAALDMDVLDCEIRQAVFFDTPDLKLDKAGIVLRARRIRKEGDTVIKLRPLVPAEVPDELRRSAGFKVELDAMPGSFVCSGSLRAKADNAEVRGILTGSRPIRKLFTRVQRRLYAVRAPKDIAMDSLMPFGPINIAKLKFVPPGFGRSLVAELWFYPDGSRILELSIKCRPDEALRAAAEARAFLTWRGVEVTGEQQAKTRKTLEYFSSLREDKTGTHD
jgi:hypothetical protein